MFANKHSADAGVFNINRFFRFSSNQTDDILLRNTIRKCLKCVRCKDNPKNI